jgi:hypothetical protein
MLSVGKVGWGRIYNNYTRVSLIINEDVAYLLICTNRNTLLISTLLVHCIARHAATAKSSVGKKVNYYLTHAFPLTTQEEVTLHDLAIHFQSY